MAWCYIVRNRIQRHTEESTGLISNWYNHIMQVWPVMESHTDAEFTVHITSFTEKIGTGETNGCNDGIPLFRLMDCSRGAELWGFWVKKVATSHQTAGIQSPFYIVWANNRICVFSFTGSTDQRITAEFRAEQNYTFNLYNPRAAFIRGYKLSFLLFNFPIIGRVTASLWVTDAP